MSEQGRSSGIQFGDAGGNVSVRAGGDVVCGDKVTTTRGGGFGSDRRKQQFQMELEALREILRQAKAALDASSALGADEKTRSPPRSSNS